ncbi:MAG: pentapeptide repeat-containing protein [Bryobacteraceae bacterium]
MTVYGRDSIPREELESRLELEDLAAKARAMKKEQVLSTLLISFYFKAGSSSFGCEFAHKSLREYLFAEHLVKILKSYGSEVRGDLPKRTPYWKDFDAEDPRYRLVRALAECLCAQWMRPEVYFHLRSLITWEIWRVTAGDAETTACGMDEWLRVHAGLVDAWDWWGEGVPQRCQPAREHGGWKLKEPYLVEVSKDCLPRVPEDRNTPPQPPRVVTMDAHLGDALFRLIGLVHGELCGKGIGVQFRPSGERPEYFRCYADRINACGWYPWGRFPSTCPMRWMDLHGADLQGVDLFAADLYAADLRKADMRGADMRGAYLRKANFDGTNLDGTIIYESDLETFIKGYVGKLHPVDRD